QAAVLDVKLRHLPEWITHRRRIAALYQEGLSDIPDIRLPHFSDPRREDVYQNYVIRTPLCDRLRAHLGENGIETLVHWPKPMWEHKDLRLDTPSLPVTACLCREVLSLPMSAETTEEHVRITVRAIRDCVSRPG
ncbi:MAG: DegT/DnrJ/EryC1/StrS family aminotransferase, partial [Nitrospiraceae bacterium]